MTDMDSSAVSSKKIASDRTSPSKTLLFVTKALLLGGFAGAISWAVCPLLFDSFEPFDTGLGLVTGQTLLSAVAIYIGARLGFWYLLIALVGAHVGQNLYAYFTGNAEAKAWIVVGILTSTFLLVGPFIAGAITVAVARTKRKKAN